MVLSDKFYSGSNISEIIGPGSLILHHTGRITCLSVFNELGVNYIIL